MGIKKKMVNLWYDAFGSAGGFIIDVIIWVIFASSIGGFGFWYWFNKIVYKYTFIELDAKGNMITRKAKIIKNQKRIKKFAIKEYNQPEHYLSIKEYNGFFNGKPCRVVSWDGQGNLTYTSGLKVDKAQYLTTALLEVERTEAVDGQMEASEKASFMNTAQKWMLTGMVIMFIFLMIGMITIAKYGFEQAGAISNGGQMFKEASENFKQGSDILRANTIINENLVKVLVKDYNLTLEQDLIAR